MQTLKKYVPPTEFYIDDSEERKAEFKAGVVGFFVGIVFAAILFKFVIIPAFYIAQL